MAKNKAGKVLFFVVLLLGLLITACAEVRFHTIPAPPPTAKLRVLVNPVVGSAPHRGWGKPDEEWAQSQTQNIGKILERMGIYELPSGEEVLQAFGHQNIPWSAWERGEWALARDAGRAIHADYTLLVERSYAQGMRFYSAVLVNVDTGRRFAIALRVPKMKGYKEEWQAVNRFTCRELFHEAKGDMLTTALRKGRVTSPGEVKPAAPVAESSIQQVATRELDLQTLMTQEQKQEGQPRLAVYDFEAAEPLRIAALIFSEGIREELSRLGFTLVNRENITKVLEEMALQQTGLVDEKQAVQAGKGLAANQIVMGRFATLGKNSILQAKRIEIENMVTLSLGSLNCPLGREEASLARISELARKLAGRP